MNSFNDFVKTSLSSLKGTTGVFYKDLETGETVKEGDDVFEAASVIKIWIMAALFNRIKEGKLHMGDTLIISNSDKVPFAGVIDYADMDNADRLPDDMFPESGVLSYMHADMEVTMSDLCRLMITISDNTAANILIKILGIDYINKCMKENGCEKSVLARRLFDDDAASRGLENMISLEETGVFFEKLYNRELISEAASREMTAILQNQQIAYKIPFFMRSIPIAHKTGEDCGITNDMGIVYAKHPFIICFGSNNTNVPDADRACQDISLHAFRHSSKTKTNNIK